MSLTKFVRLIVCLAAILSVRAVSVFAAVTIDPATIEIISYSSATKQAAEELQLHLEKITGVKPPIRSAATAGAYSFWLEKSSLGDNSEACSWTIGETNAIFRGKVDFAVTDFLEDSIGVRWPGADVIIAPEMNPLVVQITEGSFAPELNMRIIRHSSELKSTNEIFSRRMRKGQHDNPSYGHAFTKYWGRFGATHPEYFALRADGLRAPIGVTAEELNDNIAAVLAMDVWDQVGMCVTSTGLQHQVIADWVAAGTPEYINLCENDISGTDSCHCEACEALDEPIPEDADLVAGTFHADRYVWFGNEILKLAREIRSDVKVCYYAYNGTQDPPHRFTPDPACVIGIVPTTFTYEAIDAYVGGWKAAGLNRFFYRPNRHYYYGMLDLPPGYEEHFFNIFQTMIQAGCLGFDYDSGGVGRQFMCWLDSYILYHAMQDPSKSFAYWEDHYFSAFGTAAADMKAYYRFWRNEIWKERIEPNLAQLTVSGKWYNVARGIIWTLGNYYQAEDFDRSLPFLTKAAARPLTVTQRQLIARIRNCHEQGKAFVNAVANKSETNTRKLAALRDMYDISRYSWSEQYYGDVTGIEAFYGSEETETTTEIPVLAFYPFKDGANGANLTSTILTNSVGTEYGIASRTAHAWSGGGVWATNAIPGKYLVTGSGYQPQGLYVANFASVCLAGRTATGTQESAPYGTQSGSSMSCSGLASKLSDGAGWTVEAYIYIPAEKYCSYSPVLSMDVGLSYHDVATSLQILPTSSSGEWRLYLPNAPYMTDAHASTDKYPIITQLGRSNLATWIHLALTYEGTTQKLTFYLDHVKKGSLTLPFVGATQEKDLVLGNMSWRGFVSGLRVSTRALTTDEMLYAADSPTGAPEVAFHWPFEGEVGAVPSEGSSMAATKESGESVSPILAARQPCKIYETGEHVRDSVGVVQLQSVEKRAQATFATGSRVVQEDGAFPAVYGDFTMEGFFRFDRETWEEKVADRVTNGQAEIRPYCLAFGQAWVASGRTMWGLNFKRKDGVYFPRLRGTACDASGNWIGFDESLETPIQIGDGQWHHYALVYDHAAMVALLFEDGAFVDAFLLDNPLALAQQRIDMNGKNTEYSIGYDGGAHGFDGWVDEVRLTRRMLNPAEFLQPKNYIGTRFILR